ncbi:uncharacterized protein LOC134233745 [Saccostrea cucullata]|uniref:uncharacterized protein LOC134233745 n=1 Tax=Saccostrea cuccullata TaxID=36930 RepID=UPI002ED4C89E
MGMFSCPVDIPSWNLASHRLQCVEPNYYHCLTNENDGATEQCLSRVWIQKEMCPEYNSEAGRIDATACLSEGCPNSTFWSNEVYKFSMCLDRYKLTSTHSFQSMTTTEADLQSPTTLIVIIVACLVLLIFIISAVICVVLRRKKHKSACNNQNTEEGTCTPLNDADMKTMVNIEENKKIYSRERDLAMIKTREKAMKPYEAETESMQLIMNDKEEKENYTAIDFNISRVWVIVSNSNIKTAAKLQTISQKHSDSELSYIGIQRNWKVDLPLKKVIIFRSDYFSTLDEITKDLDELYEYLQTQQKLCLVFEITQEKWRILRKEDKLMQLAKVIRIS